MVVKDLLSIQLFDSLEKVVIENHKKYFSNYPQEVVELEFDDIRKLYGDTYIKGWRILADLKDGTKIELDVLLDYRIPFSTPKIALVDKSYFMKWAHVEKNGILSIRHSNDKVTHITGTELTEYFINSAIELINQNILGINSADFCNEFKSYWINFIDNSQRNPVEVCLLAEKATTSFQAYYTKIDRKILISDSIPKAEKWLSDYLNKVKIDDYIFKKCAVFYLNKPIYPYQYPKNNRELADLIESSDKILLNNLVPNEYDSVPVVITFNTENGPAYGCVWLTEPSEFNQMKKKYEYHRFNGFKNKKNAPPERYFSTHAKTEFASVEVLNKEWLIERGGKGYFPEISKSKISIIGCGALGSGIARLLTQAGVGSINLIDQEFLEWNNIGRHLLGAEYVGQKKTDGLKSYLCKQLPASTNIESYPYNWEQAFKKDSSILSSQDLIISTTGNWDSEDALNYLFNNNAYIPPVLYGWFEPYGICGHSILVTKFGGCFSCGIDSFGNFIHPLTLWSQDNYLKREPACSAMYNTYGLIDIQPIQAMIVSTVLDYLQKKIRYSEHRYWLGDTTLLQELKGELNKDTSYYNDYRKFSITSKQWKVNKSCLYKH
jgi:hypothetical protein